MLGYSIRATFNGSYFDFSLVVPDTSVVFFIELMNENLISPNMHDQLNIILDMRYKNFFPKDYLSDQLFLK